MENNAKTREILNDLVKINNDRVEGYEKALKELGSGDTDLKVLYQQYAQQSRSFSSQLNAELGKQSGEKTDGTTASGKIYRAWMDVKSAFSGDDRKTTLESCEFGEDAAQKAYKEALSDTTQLPGNLAGLISRQQAELKSAHDTIKRQRDAHKAGR